jgi:hypothetical protein
MFLKLDYAMELVIELIALMTDNECVGVTCQSFKDFEELFRAPDVKRRVEDFIHDEKVG